MRVGRSKKGFTVVELIVVIIVIAILATITVVAYNGIRGQTQAAAVADGLKQIEKSMHLWILKDGLSKWPDDDVTGGGQPLSELIAENPNLRRYLQSVPAVQGVETEEWFYDNEGDTKSECSGTYNGVNIVIRYVITRAIAQKVDDDIDDGNLSCGKVRYADQRIFYALSYDEDKLD